MRESAHWSCWQTLKEITNTPKFVTPKIVVSGLLLMPKNCSLLMCWWKKEPPLKRLTYILEDFIKQKRTLLKKHPDVWEGSMQPNCEPLFVRVSRCQYETSLWEPLCMRTLTLSVFAAPYVVILQLHLCLQSSLKHLVRQIITGSHSNIYMREWSVTDG